MKYFLFALTFLCIHPLQAQVSVSMQDAAYLATLKAVISYKIEDEKNAEKVDKLRQDEKFNKQLTKMLEKLHNEKPKTATDKRVYQILLKAGQNIYNELN